MKKILVAILCLFFLLSICGCQKEESDAIRFKKEYESLNDLKNQDGKVYPEIYIDANNKVKYADSIDVVELLTNGTHIVYLGWPECLWCRRSIPELIDVVNENSGIYIYYCNLKEIREGYQANEKKAEELYLAIDECLKESDYPFDSLLEKNDDGSYKIVSSLIYFIKDGNIIAVHKRTVPSHIDGYEPLDEIQKKELHDIFQKYIDEMSKYDPPGCNEC